jgi:uncharacterized lipoprotein NlpE involved in copper resistance
MKLLVSACFLVVLVSCQLQKSTSQKPSEQLKGMWKLDRFESLNETNNQWGIDSSRIGYQGYILYDGKGHMAIHLTPGEYAQTQNTNSIDSLSILELKEKVKHYRSNYVYFATYNATDSLVNHVKLSATESADVGKTSTRYYQIKKDTLVMITKEKVLGKKLRLKWIKVD